MPCLCFTHNDFLKIIEVLGGWVLSEFSPSPDTNASFVRGNPLTFIDGLIIIFG
jgi:hypothetical protein